MRALQNLFWNWDVGIRRFQYALGMLAVFAAAFAWESVLGIPTQLAPKVQDAPSRIFILVVGSVTGTDPYPWVALLSMVPLMWIALHWTARRLRDAGWSTRLAPLVLISVANFLFAGLLCFVPSKGSMATSDEAGPDPKFSEFVLTSLLTAFLGVALTFASVQLLNTYGFGLFTVIPVGLAILSCVVYGSFRRRDFGECLKVSMATGAIGSCLLLLFGIEGLVCIVMALPILFIETVVGCVIGTFLQKAMHKPVYGPVLSFATPLLMLGSAFVQPRVTSPVLVATTVVDVRGDPWEAWHKVVSYPPLPPCDNLLFRAGLAHPDRVDLKGEGVGATRVCQLSTGSMPEVVTTWEPGSLLRFDVLSNPPSMTELSPWPISPHHLRDTCTMVRGEIRLQSLPGNRTRLIGTTWYRNNMEPAWYWRLWSDAHIHAVHRRAFSAIKT